MISRLSFLVAIAFMVMAAPAFADEPDGYLEGDKLAGILKISSVQTGGFAGSLSQTVTVEPDGVWESQRKIGARGTPGAGKLTPEQLKELAAELEKLELLGLPKVIGSDQPIKSPPIIADGASTTIELAFGEKQVTANFADGRDVDEETAKLHGRLRAIMNAVYKVTLNSP